MILSEIQNPIIVIAGPSGSGKSTIFKFLLTQFPTLCLAVSVTTRKIRGHEIDGEQYHFITEEEFRQRLENNEFVEHEEVYTGKFYGTLTSEIHKITDLGKVPLLELDVKGALSIKEIFPDRAYLIFIDPPSIESLETRLRLRGTESEENLKIRLERAEYEISQKVHFDAVVINDDLSIAQTEAVECVKTVIR